MSTVPFRNKIIFPLAKARCKKCRRTIYWGKMRAGNKFYPPFADDQATSWHHCGELSSDTSSLSIKSTDISELKDRKRRNTTDDVQPSDKKKHRDRPQFHRFSIAELTSHTTQLIQQLRDYGRQAV